MEFVTDTDRQFYFCIEDKLHLLSSHINKCLKVIKSCNFVLKQINNRVLFDGMQNFISISKYSSTVATIFLPLILIASI